MSAIDQYRHKCIGVIECPSSYELIPGKAHRNIPVYRLDEDIPNEETDFEGKKGDILIGGGSGESASLRISIPEAFLFFTHEDWDEFESVDQITKAFWTMNDAYVFCEGYHKLGWKPPEIIELWLTKILINFLKDYYYEVYKNYIGKNEIEMKNSIFRLPTDEEINIL